MICKEWAASQENEGEKLTLFLSKIKNIDKKKYAHNVKLSWQKKKYLIKNLFCLKSKQL